MKVVIIYDIVYYYQHYQVNLYELQIFELKMTIQDLKVSLNISFKKYPKIKIDLFININIYM